jgi:hypothetical protein
MKVRTRLRVLENKVLRRRKLGCKREEVTADWKELHNEQRHDFYPLPRVSTVIKQMLI